jgi:sugar/nucleoside kinase (ribokinase family)
MSDAQPARVVVVGPVNMDLFMRGEAPLEREVLNSWVGPSDVQLIVAGSIGYTIQAMAQLGCRVDVCTTIGEDAFGSHIRRELEAAGIGLGYATTGKGDTAIALYVLLFGGTKRPMTYRLPGFEPWPDPLPEFGGPAGSIDLLHCGGLLHFPAMWGRTLAERFATARRQGVLTSLDPQFPLVATPAPWLPHIADVLGETDVLLCDEGEAGQIFDVDTPETAIAMAHRLGPRIVAIKRGAAGCIVSDGRRLVRQAAIPVQAELVREAVGAGDAFDSGFLDTLLRGGDIAAAARFATAAAALSLRARGGAEGIAGRPAVLAIQAEVPETVIGSAIR